MNDDKLMTTVKEPFAGVRMDTPVEQIMSRGRAVRARRRIPGVAGAMAVLAAVALAGDQAARRQGRDLLLEAERSGRTATQAPRGRHPGQRHCRPYQSCGQAYTGPVRTHGYQQSSTAAPGSKTPSHIIIDPSALPKGAGLEIAVQVPRPGGDVQGLAGLVQASPACTGS